MTDLREAVERVAPWAGWPKLPQPDGSIIYGVEANSPMVDADGNVTDAGAGDLERRVVAEGWGINTSGAPLADWRCTVRFHDGAVGFLGVHPDRNTAALLAVAEALEKTNG